jgi:drug/metabolite transporter (DMT)-like permease
VLLGVEELEVDEEHRDDERDEADVEKKRHFHDVRDSIADMKQQTTGIAMAAGAAAAFGTLAIFAKLAYDEGAGPISLLGARFAIAAALMLGWHALAKRSVGLPRKKLVALLLLGGGGYAFESSLFFLALERAPAAVVELIFYSFPLWVNLIGLAIGLERWRAGVAGALLLGSAGVALIFTVQLDSLAGPLLALAAAVAVAVYFISAQLVIEDVPPSVAATWTAAAAAVSLSITGLLLGQPLPAGAWAPAAGLGLATAFAFFGLYGAIARIGSARTSIANMLEPVTTVFLAALILDERLTIRILAGTALVVSALPVLLRTSEGPAAADAPA